MIAGIRVRRCMAILSAAMLFYSSGCAVYWAPGLWNRAGAPTVTYPTATPPFQTPPNSNMPPITGNPTDILRSSYSPLNYPYPVANNPATGEMLANLQSRWMQSESERQALQERVRTLESKLNSEKQVVVQANYEVEQSNLELKKARSEMARWRSDLDDLRSKLQTTERDSKRSLEAIVRTLEDYLRQKSPQLPGLMN